MAIQKKISRENLRAKYLRVRRGFQRPRTHGAGRRPFERQSFVWEARLEGMAPEIDGKLYLTDIELRGGEVAEAGDIAALNYQDGRLRPGRARRRNSAAACRGAAPMPPVPAAEKLHRIATGAPLRVLA